MAQATRQAPRITLRIPKQRSVAWTIGYTPNLTIGVWVGNTDGHPMQEVLSSMSAGRVWRESMDTAIDHLQRPAEGFQRPAGLLGSL